MNEPEKMTARKLLKLPPGLLSRLNKAAGFHNEDANEIVRRAVVKELDQMDQQQAVESQRMAKLRALAQAKGGKLDAAIDELLRQFTDPALPGMAELAGAAVPAANGTDG